MSPLDQVLRAAKQLSDEGRTPTLALIKTKLGVSVPLPVLIQGLQQYKTMSSTDRDSINNSAKEAPELEPQLANAEQLKIAELEKNITMLKKQLLSMDKRLAQLESTSIEQNGASQ
ncbi:hypothetical protein [Shewanella youngdeokensis]|uniref:KfrA N-terminal DNA-binding domain-containing protein n=1 Tax=Shewanella youngdeokensis TaxID=2999068 RepID=A0ABZ0JWW8_9GAMM|nr:hypothetical protein RGE70_13050 [Shewanella sp. DAU334]